METAPSTESTCRNLDVGEPTVSLHPGNRTFYNGTEIARVPLLVSGRASNGSHRVVDERALVVSARDVRAVRVGLAFD
jgi:hypothetical protein